MSDTAQYANAWGRLAGFNLAAEAQATLSGGDWTLPLSNLLDDRLRSYPARVLQTGDPETDLPKAVIQVDFGVRRVWDFCGLFWSSMHRGGRWRIESGIAAHADQSDTGWMDAIPRIHSTADLPFEAENWFDGRPTERELEWYGRHLLHMRASTLSSRYLRISLDNSGAPSATHLDIGFLYIAGLWSPSFNHSFGLRQGLRFRDLAEEAPSGHKAFARRRSPRTLSVPYKALWKDTAMTLLDVQRQVGPAGLVLYAPAAVEPKHLFREVFLARFTAPAELEFYAPRGRRRTQLELEEAL
ncbi:hypothetical protein [Oceanibaculum indicum]|uniref:Uncharacterized protein n=1 Tax=Oceanibaculum indicum P24 TaxID=1207063 RepID=K2J743_9PROT|nr:hypothetical protein [Oceanibaculum indicum]EKE70898.1 hypothetical protein P24_15184 [Oceanibaculum indicum P24]